MGGWRRPVRVVASVLAGATVALGVALAQDQPSTEPSAPIVVPVAPSVQNLPAAPAADVAPPAAAAGVPPETPLPVPAPGPPPLASSELPLPSRDGPEAGRLSSPSGDAGTILTPPATVPPPSAPLPSTAPGATQPPAATAPPRLPPAALPSATADAPPTTPQMAPPSPPDTPAGPTTLPLASPEGPAQPKTLSPAEAAGVPPAPAGDRAPTPDEPATAVAGSAPDAGLAGAPDAERLIEAEIIPTLDRLANTALTLQNAVLRHCLVGHAETRDALEPAYAYAIEASAAVLPLSFGSEEAVSAPDRLLTTAVSTAFSTSKLEAVMQGAAPIPRSLKELANEEAALLGLPALEILLLRRSYPSDFLLENRCTLAVPVAASIVDTAVRARARWLNRDVAAHWQGDQAELAPRLRLRDLVQGTIDTVDRVALDLVDFQRMATDKSAFRFTRPRHGLVYLIAAAEALRAHVKRLAVFAKPDSGAAVLLGEIGDALTVSCVRLLAIATGEADDGAYLIAFEQAHGDIINELPQAFGFDASAFTRALTSIDMRRAAAEEQ